MGVGETTGDSIHIGLGYTVDATGIRIWPLRRYHRRWENLESVDVGGVLIKGNWEFAVNLQYANPRRRKLRITTGSKTADLLKIVRLLSWVKAARPGAADWSDVQLANLFAAAEAAEHPAFFEGDITDDVRMRRAELRCAALNIDGALKDWTMLIEQRSAHASKAAQLKVRTLASTGRLDDAIEAVGEYVLYRPNDTEVRTELATILIASDDKRARRLTDIIFEKCPIGNPPLLLSLAWQAIRNRDWTDAARRLDQIAAFDPRLSDEERKVLRKARETLERFRNNPKAVFRESTIPNLMVKGRGWFVPAIVVVLLLLPAAFVAPMFVRESWNLVRLARDGENADLVELIRPSGKTASGDFIQEIRYEFAPDARLAEPLHPRTPPIGTKEFDEWLEKEDRKLDEFRHTGHYPVHEGWFDGSAILFDPTAEGIRADKSLQFVTYLPSDHSVSTIGPITWTRICFTWLGAPRSALPPMFLVVMLATIGVERLRRRRRRQSRGYEI